MIVKELRHTARSTGIWDSEFNYKTTLWVLLRCWVDDTLISIGEGRILELVNKILDLALKIYFRLSWLDCSSRVKIFSQTGSSSSSNKKVVIWKLSSAESKIG